LYCELGWLPRWDFQCSHGGINAAHHLANPMLEMLDTDQSWKADVILRHARLGVGAPSGWGYLDMKADPPADLPDAYILAPLQVEGDVNMRHVPEHMRTARGFIEAVTQHVIRHAPHLPIVFKQHPARAAAKQVRIPTIRSMDFVAPHSNGDVYGYIKDPRCEAVIVANSNVANDCLLYDKPCVALGNGIWPAGVFLRSLAHLDGWAAGEQMRRMYVYWLSKTQWTLADCRNLRRVEWAIGDAAYS
jgi:hypothetical protein